MNGVQLAITIVTAVLGTGGIGVAIAQHLKNRSDQKLAQAPDWATFSKELRESLADERAEAAREAEARDLRIAALQESLSLRDTAMRARDRHIEALKQQIWLRQEPPPVEPPEPY